MNEQMITGCQPDSGKPTVRDERGACRNVAVKGAGLRASGKLLELPPDPIDGARAVFLPDKGQLAAVSDDKLQRPVGIGTTEADRSVLVWRMSQYER